MQDADSDEQASLIYISMSNVHNNINVDPKAEQREVERKIHGRCQKRVLPNPNNEVWVCRWCTLENRIGVRLCGGCQRKRTEEPSLPKKWNCCVCSYENNAACCKCEMCGTMKFA